MTSLDNRFINMLTSDQYALSADVTAQCRDVTAVSRAMQKGDRYKTELCRTYEEIGTCRYGDKCQFAHGVSELRTVQRHPKYKTDLCRTFHSTGFCPYGARCHFIHGEQQHKMSLTSSPSLGRKQVSVESRDSDIGRLLGVIDDSVKLQFIEYIVSQLKQFDTLSLSPNSDDSPRSPISPPFNTCQQMSAFSLLNKPTRSIFA